MTSIFLEDIRLKASIIEPNITNITSIEDIKLIANYIRQKNFFELRNGDSKMCRRINSEIAFWINNHTKDRAEVWWCPNYPNLRDNAIPMEHVVAVIQNSNANKFVVDATAAQTTIADSNLLIKSIPEDCIIKDALNMNLGGNNWFILM